MIARSFLGEFMSVRIIVDWRDLDDEAGGWDQLRCLYAYWAPDGELLYIGKAWGKTVRERWRYESKPHYWTDIERDRGIYEHYTSVGTISLARNQRLTHELLADIESLLIHRLQPWGNLQCRRSRIERPGLEVQCRGDWFERRATYRDAA